MKLELCHFSQQKIYPSRGRRFVKVDGKVFNFANGKCSRSYFMRRNPRNTRWTILYRRKHRKGTVEEEKKRRTRRNVKFTRAIVGATVESILQKRNQKPEVRKAQREQAIRAAKEKASAKKKAKVQAASAKATQKAQQAKQKATKVVSKGGGGGSRGGQRR